MLAILTSLLLSAIPTTAEAVPLTDYEIRRGKPDLPGALWGDRRAYWTGDAPARFVAVLPKSASVGLELTEILPAPSTIAPKVTTWSAPVAGAGTGKVLATLNLGALAPGQYSLVMRSGATASAPYLFGRSALKRVQAVWPPGGIKMNPVQVDGWVTTGVSFPAMNPWMSSKLGLFEGEHQVPAQWAKASTWEPNGGGMKWVRLSYYARAGHSYTIRLNQTGIASKSPVSISRTGQGFTFRPGGQVDPSALYLVDSAGVRYTGVGDYYEITDSGPLFARGLASGWFVSASGTRFNRFEVLWSAYSGQAAIRVQTRVILTEDTRARQIADAGYTVPAKGAWSLSLDDKIWSGSGPAFMAQEKVDQIRMVSTSTVMGSRSGSWITAGDTMIALSGMAPRFPKELEFTGKSLVVHSWPRHSRLVFTTAERTKRRTIGSLLYAHQGALNLALPDLEYAALKSWDTPEKPGSRDWVWDAEDSLPKARVSTAEGVALRSEFIITKSWGLKDEYLAHVHSLPDPSWIVSTGALDPVGVRGPGPIDAFLDAIPLSMENVARAEQGYGAWIWPGTHDNWDPIQRQPQLHRLWSSSHYQQVGLWWLLYARGNDFWTLAREATATWLDVGTVNYVNPENPPRFHTLGAEHHVKAFLPWGAATAEMGEVESDAGTTFHYIDPDAARYAWLMSGDEFAHRAYLVWGQDVIRRQVSPSATREGTTLLPFMLAYYETTWDPQALIWLGALADKLRARDVSYYPNTNHAEWYPWYDRYYSRARDPRVLDLAKQAVSEGRDSLSMAVFLWRNGGPSSVLRAKIGEVWDLVHSTYRRPGDALDGIGLQQTAVHLHWIRELPEFMDAVQAARLPIEPDLHTTWYPYGRDPGFVRIRTSGPMRIVVANAARLRVNGQRYDYVMGSTLAVARDPGAPGLVEANTYRALVGAPVSDHDVLEFAPKVEMFWAGRLSGTTTGSGTLRLVADTRGERVQPLFARIDGADFTLLAGSEQPTLDIPLAPGKHSVYLYSRTSGSFIWTGATPLIMEPK